MKNAYWDQNLYLNKNDLIKEIKKIASTIKKDVNFMEVCGGHTYSIIKFGIKEILPKNVNLISGPGCPVCITSANDIDSIIEIAKSNVPIATYADMLRVKGSKYSLEDIKSKGAIIKTIYSTSELIELKKHYPNIVFFAIGFETTIPMTTFVLQNNIPVFSSHKALLPGLRALIDEKLNIDGFILPGHVCSVIGYKDFKSLNIYQAVSGFEAEHLLRSIYALLVLIKNEKKDVVNTYFEVVKKEGNIKAKKLINKHFILNDSNWRGIGVISNSGYEVMNNKLNAKVIYKDKLKNIQTEKKSLCRCGEVLKGIISPLKCPLFSKRCTPNNPIGACMVSSEGSCNIYYLFNEQRNN
ncbi:MAG: hydrogenase formation protein HypD [Candidatus Woesearchaeota archaeon]